ncbi:unnamed protein product [Cylindrotheca closterium]|uniref:Uncharacterized protein n=1 Tax=Cylindrotheca closterium TaxID=2856 RepID=A0AAD2JHH2_9STRA|nr:unnamed protein product [Cylindrotheca closterium]
MTFSNRDELISRIHLIGPASEGFHLANDDDLSQVTISTTRTKKHEERYNRALETAASSLQDALEVMIHEVGEYPPASLLQSAFAMVLEAKSQACQMHVPKLASMQNESTDIPRKIVMGKKFKFNHSVTNRCGSYYGTVNKDGKPDGHGTIIYSSMNTFQGLWHRGQRKTGTYIQYYDSKLRKLREPIVYQGQFADSKRNQSHGFGIMYVGRKYVWSGQMVNGKVKSMQSSAASTSLPCSIDGLCHQMAAPFDGSKRSPTISKQNEGWDEDEFSFLPSIVSTRETADGIVINAPSSAYKVCH